MPIHQIIAVTGTKGKTSLVRLLDHALQTVTDSVVRVDTSGAYVNGTLRFSDQDSRDIWGYAVTNAPGRFLTLHPRKTGISILECTLFSARTGLGYKRHDIGIFTNVFEDHIGSFPNITTKQDIADMKSFVFRRLKTTGYAIYNADDPLVTGQLGKATEGVKKIAVSLDPNLGNFDGQFSCSLQGEKIELRDPKGKLVASLATLDLPWLDNEYKPSCYLALFAVAGLYAVTSPSNFKKALQALQTYSFDPDGGRMIRLSLPNQATVVMDYAHEKVSLNEIASYARHLAGVSGKVIGVLRLAPSRSQALVTDTARSIYDAFDEYVIYDKVDGHFRKPELVRGYTGSREVVGKMATLFSAALKSLGPKPVHTVLREDQAIERAANLSYKGDVIVYIVGDDPGRSRRFLEQGQVLSK